MKERTALMGLVLMGLAGCIQPFAHSKAETVVEKPKEVEVKTIGKVASVENTAQVEVFGIGLVIGLDGTGGGAPPGPYRSVLEDQLPKLNKIDNVKQFLAANASSTSMVLISARIPAGARKNDQRENRHLATGHRSSPWVFPSGLM